MARETVIHFKNENINDINRGIKSGSLGLEEILDDNNQLKFGTCNSSKFTCTLIGADDLTGEEIEVYQNVDGIRNDIFSGIISSCVLDKNRIDRKLTAYDKLYAYKDVDVWDWYNKLTYPISLLEFRNSLFEYMGITQVQQTLVNDTMLISKTVSQTEMSFETVLEAMCELNGCYGIMNRQGLFEYVTLDNSTITDIKDNVRSSSEYELYNVKRIDKVQLMFEDGDIGVSYGEGDNKYSVVGNFLLYGKTEAELNRIAVNLFSVISDIVVTPANLELIKTDYKLKLGDRVLFTDRFGNEYTTIILKLEMSGVQLINETCGCELDEYRDETTTDAESEIRKLMGKANIFKRDIEQTKSTIIDVEKGLRSEITQTAKSLSIQISTLGKEISKEYDTYVLKEPPTLENYPAIDWHEYIYPGNDTYPSSTLYWAYTYETYFPHLGSVAYVEGTIDSYKFILDSNGQFRWKQVQDTQMAYIQEQIHKLELTDEGLEEKITTNTKTLTAQGERLESAETQIKANSESLTTKISKTTYDKDKQNMLSDINSQFQQLSNQISLCVTQKTYEANTVSALVVEYALSSSNTSAPTSGWSTTAPTANSGKYMWQRTSYRYADGSTKVSQVTCIQGAKGDTGVGIKSIITYYYLSKSSTSTTGGSWSTICPTYTGTKDNPKYYWTKQRITWDDNSVVDTTPVVDYGISSANQTSKTTEAKLDLKIDKDDFGAIVSALEGYADNIKFNANAKLDLSSGGTLSLGSKSTLSIVSNSLNIDSTYFKVGTNGVTTITKGKIGYYYVQGNKITGYPNGVESTSVYPCFEMTAGTNPIVIMSKTSDNKYLAQTSIQPGIIHLIGASSANNIDGPAVKIYTQSTNQTTLLVSGRSHRKYNSSSYELDGTAIIENGISVGFDTTATGNAAAVALVDRYAQISCASGIKLGVYTYNAPDLYYSTKFSQYNYGMVGTVLTSSNTESNVPLRLIVDEYRSCAVITKTTTTAGNYYYLPMIAYRPSNTSNPVSPIKMKYEYMNGSYGIHFYNSYGTSLAFQEDGNLVIYNANKKPIWTAGVNNGSTPLS